MSFLPWSSDGRRTLRAVTQSVILLAFLYLLWRLADAKDTHWLIAVIAIFVTGTQIIDGVRSFKIGKDGLEADGNNEP